MLEGACCIDLGGSLITQAGLGTLYTDAFMQHWLHMDSLLINDLLVSHVEDDPRELKNFLLVCAVDFRARCHLPPRNTSAIVLVTGDASCLLPPHSHAC